MAIKITIGMPLTIGNTRWSVTRADDMQGVPIGRNEEVLWDKAILDEVSTETENSNYSKEL